MTKKFTQWFCRSFLVYLKSTCYHWRVSMLLMLMCAGKELPRSTLMFKKLPIDLWCQRHFHWYDLMMGESQYIVDITANKGLQHRKLSDAVKSWIRDLQTPSLLQSFQEPCCSQNIHAGPLLPCLQFFRYHKKFREQGWHRQSDYCLGFHFAQSKHQLLYSVLKWNKVAELVSRTVSMNCIFIRK